jgi:hypothetical protein
VAPAARRPADRFVEGTVPGVESLPTNDVGMEALSVFEKHRAREAAKAYQQALSEWQAQRDGYAELLQVAESFTGVGSDQLILKAGEAIFFTVTGAALVEERRGPGEWKGHSQGFSIPVGSIHGRSIRYRVGATRGHLVQGAPVTTAIDRGAVYITNQRVIFEGGKQTRECAFAKLIGFQHSDAEGSTTFSLSNRQKPTTLQYGPTLSASFDFRLDLALAHFRGTVSDLVSTVKQDLAQTEAARPSPAATLDT